MKKLINNPSNIVDETLDGLVAANPDTIRRPAGTTMVLRKDAPIEDKVAVITGGGSGHEPASSGFVGSGMLDGMVLGDVFASPSANQIADLIEIFSEAAGISAIIGNYEGDVMNFETAIEMVELEYDLDIEVVIVDDDVATKGTERGGRGINGMVLVHKIAGAMSAEGGSLAEVTSVAEKANDNVASMGVGLTSCTHPGRGEPTIDIGPDEVEYGIGNHGEAGVERGELTSADEITGRLTDEIFEDLDVGAGDELVTMINGMGATPLSELYIVNRALAGRINEVGAESVRSWVGEFTTSLDMAGCSISVLRVDEELKELATAPTTTPGFKVTDHEHLG